jgi:ABC-type glucose/galactose transport system permease subunit
MDSLKLFPIFENKFVYLNDVYRVIIPSIIVPVLVPILFVTALDQFIQLVKNIFVVPHVVFAVLMGTAIILYGLPKLLHNESRNFDTKKSNKTATRFSQRLRQKAGIL